MIYILFSFCVWDKQKNLRFLFTSTFFFLIFTLENVFTHTTCTHTGDYVKITARMESQCYPLKTNRTYPILLLPLHHDTPTTAGRGRSQQPRVCSNGSFKSEKYQVVFTSVLPWLCASLSYMQYQLCNELISHRKPSRCKWD